MAANDSFKEAFQARNRAWAQAMTAENPQFFADSAKSQAPEFLWIGCSDSRVPANEIVGLKPGEMFVHRNIANLVHEIDINCLSVMTYAIDVLKVRHVIVCGHYGCGGVRAAMDRVDAGLIDNWLKPVRTVYQANNAKLDAISEPDDRVNALCELNVRHQVVNVARTSIVQNAWARGQALSIHGYIYSLKDGLLHDLDFSLSGVDGIEAAHRLAVENA